MRKEQPNTVIEPKKGVGISKEGTARLRETGLGSRKVTRDNGLDSRNQRSTILLY